jgi:D-glycero-D-manno-heptose 1,7-bisphosphate phosphatase
VINFIDNSGLWVEIRSKANKLPFSGVPALFLDRDGTIVEEVLYLHKAKEMRLEPDAPKTIKLANEKGIPVIIVTNQSGIGRGYYEWQDFCDVQNAMLEELKSFDAIIDAVFACPFHYHGKGPYIHKNHPDRKPNPGMLLKAANLMSIDLHKSWIAGDRASDVGAGRSAECEGGVHLKTGHGSEAGEDEAADEYKSKKFSVLHCHSISELPNIVPLLKTR